MKKIYGDVVLITGASSGIGKATAEFLAKHGYKVYGTSRKAYFETEEQVAATSDSSGFIKMIPLDVCSDDSVKKAVSYVYEKEGHIDILINNAGFGIAGSVEDTSPEEAFAQFNTNFFGTHRMLRAVLPIMRKQGKGLIINVSSVAGVFPIPFQSMYSASKYAVESMTEALRMELKPFGIKVSMVEPGDTRTGFTDQRLYAKDAQNSVYKKYFTKSVTSMEKSERNGPGPHVVVKEIARIINSKNPPIRVTSGFSYKLFVFLKRFFPPRFIQFVISKMY
ncbi:SDR family oxidoreductase [Fonticella tunisiensis]|uniref:Short-subunit dehydrogenase n=1 Tax=Fonticella tunisiensis TaxID=1096341 RepID=A0A4R7KPS2_9CLOT|nr:SDR family oxidoreductase [Fonticella tunisiensis]TDT61139.1 short-subunit dehydrogenase [Fonticella tunisiensis]